MISIIYIIVTVALVILILLQQRSGGMSGLFGGDSSSFYQARRGLEKFFLWGTVILSILFVALSLWQLLAK
ncbi:MAG: preprotein translocase subunit SecG [Parcubacteria group bacterium LiPW_15]|nr:MAG: preprotein translocase subunit SecG [Parcubacteria group bacterium LiPW_15]